MSEVINPEVLPPEQTETRVAVAGTARILPFRLGREARINPVARNRLQPTHEILAIVPVY